MSHSKLNSVNYISGFFLMWICRAAVGQVACGGPGSAKDSGSHLISL